MISLEEIRKKCLLYYHKVLNRAVLGEKSFPWEISTGKIDPEEIIHNPSLLKKIKKESKEKKGFGFLLVSFQKETRKFGTQTLPSKIRFEDEIDFLRFLHKEQEFSFYKSDCDMILFKIPALMEWILKNPFLVIQESGNWEDLLSVCSYFLKNPRPGLYIRELPISVPTKFIEENKKVLRNLLDFLVPENIDYEGKDFESRFGLKKPEALVRFRILDPIIAEKSSGGLFDISVPVDEFRNLHLFGCKRIFILENKINFSNIDHFLTFPKLSGSIAIFGQGYGLGILKDCVWLNKMEILYWGDIDVQGFEILSLLREQYPQTKSFLMDKETFLKFQNFAVNGKYSKFSKLDYLTESEKETWEYLRSLGSKNRLEQERIPQEYIEKTLHSQF
ncbi:Wadjet anti-phage system protein JetD domain-containing protein [Leptospira noguchii]|uniref:Wadjet anti-phage system protein JetD domain-containing protein n=1 Tax=Leptospira noguchii TaxID=28182 RepID=UPI001FB66C32|nr:Wadjet anti-phage system protein JetD domain-containing protein [Leptospira noguchii]UOG49238.1 DUF2220 family protein [Leptospira noguchii]